jgi:hypothetical protein
MFDGHPNSANEQGLHQQQTRLTKTSRVVRVVKLMDHKRRGVVAASWRRYGVAASLRQFDGSQSSRRRGFKSTVENGTSRPCGLSNWRRVAVARHAGLWSAPELALVLACRCVAHDCVAHDVITCRHSCPDKVSENDTFRQSTHHVVCGLPLSARSRKLIPSGSPLHAPSLQR